MGDSTGAAVAAGVGFVVVSPVGKSSDTCLEVMIDRAIDANCIESLHISLRPHCDEGIDNSRSLGVVPTHMPLCRRGEEIRLSSVYA